MTTTTVHEHRLTAGEVMSRPVVTASPNDSVWEAWNLMLLHDVRHVVLTVGYRCVGIVDDRALFSLWPMGPAALRRTRVAEFTRRRTSCVLPDSDMQDVARVMDDDAVDAVPVVDEHGNLVGLITASDVIAAIAAHGVGLGEETACES